MSSIRTEYRLKRISLIKEIINTLINLLSWDMKDLERIPLPMLKDIANKLKSQTNNKPSME